MKAFLVNRVGDFGFVLGIAGVVYYTAQFGGASLDYVDAFKAAPQIAGQTFTLPGTDGVNAMTFICICLFIGAMGKSAQVPLHVWLPDSMEGPTPISALIHAATMVTAGIFMVARMSPLFEFSEYALNFVLFIGATTALFMGFLGIISNDIKRVVAYSTLSQLGYMTVALGVSAYSFGIFHLMTHAFFKALLFLAAGSVIICMHHEQDMRKMGGLFKHMPDHRDHVLDRHARADRHAVLLGLLLEGPDHRCGEAPASPAARQRDRDLRVLVRDDRRVRHGVLFVPPAVHDVPWQAALGSERRACLARARREARDACGSRAMARMAITPRDMRMPMTSRDAR